MNDFAANLVGLITGLIALFVYVIEFFAWYFRIQSRRSEVVVSAIIGTVFGGLLWSVLCRVMHWPYYMGGSGNEPHRWHAFIWGILTLTPVALFAGFITQRPVAPNLRAKVSNPEEKVEKSEAGVARKSSIVNFWADFMRVAAEFKRLGVKYFLCTALYGLLGGLGAVLFYDFGFRPYVEAAKLGYPQQELIIIVLWSAILSATTYWAFPATWLVYRKLETPFRTILQIPFAVCLSFIVILVFLCIATFTPAFDLVRGICAGIGLRLGLYCGLIAAPFINAKRLERSPRKLSRLNP